MCFYKYCPLCKHFTLHSDFLVTLTNLIHHRVCYPTEKHECWKPFGGWRKPFRFIWILCHHRRRHFHCQHHHLCICNCLCICHLQHHEWRQPVWLIWIPSRFATQRPICLLELNNHFDKDIGEIIQICFWQRQICFRQRQICFRQRHCLEKSYKYVFDITDDQQKCTDG